MRKRIGMEPCLRFRQLHVTNQSESPQPFKASRANRFQCAESKSQVDRRQGVPPAARSLDETSALVAPGMVSGAGPGIWLCVTCRMYGM